MTRRSSSDTAKKKRAGTTSSGVLQRSCACGRHIGAGSQCDACRQAEAEHPGIPSVVGEVLRSPGEPLPSGTRDLMESRFHRDFSGVRVHADNRASESAGAVNARAWTVGDHIAFQHGHYNPSSQEGRSLLAHELTHVAQNQSGLAGQGSVNAVSHPHDHAEREASEAASRVTAGGNVAVSQGPGAVMHRDLSGGAIAGIVAGSLVGAAGIGLGIAALAGAFSSGSTVPDLPSDLVQRLQPACASGATAEVRQTAIDALVAWARGQSSLGIDWSRIDWVHYDSSAGARGSQTQAEDTQHIKVLLGPEAFANPADLYSTFRHELVHVKEHETRPRSEVLSRGRGIQEIYAYLWELEHQHDTGMDRRENWGVRPDGTPDLTMGLVRVVDGLLRGINTMGYEVSQNPSAVPVAEQQAIERRVACAMTATPREVVAAVLPQAPFDQWRRECSSGSGTR